MKKEDIKLAYAVLSSNNYMGSVLITDYKGFPLEYRYSDPITPTKIQQVLYGEGLEKYIKVDVILESLIKVLSSHADILLVQDEDLLVYRHESFPIVRISQTKSTPIGEAGVLSTIKQGEYLLQTAHSQNPLRLKFPEYFDCESEAFVSVIDTLKTVGEYIDVYEPLERVSKSIDLICNQEF